MLVTVRSRWRAQRREEERAPRGRALAPAGCGQVRAVNSPAHRHRTEDPGCTGSSWSPFTLSSQTGSGMGPASWHRQSHALVEEATG